MKKFYSLLLIISVGAMTVFGQVSKAPIHKSKADQVSSIYQKLPNSSPSNPSARTGNPSNNTSAIFWTDDFSVPANWSISHAAGTTSDWVIGTNGPSGQFAIPAILSTTAANGFAMFDSDLMCDPVNGQVGDLTTVNPINCSGHPTVRLRFEESYCRFYDSTYVFVSNDGVSWTMYEVNGTLLVNDYAGGGTAGSGATQNPVSYSVDITPSAGNQTTVYLRFEFYSPTTLDTTGNNLAGCAYAWMIDDVVLEDMPANDVAIVQPPFPSEYTVTPLTQAQAVSLDAQIANTGPTVETNVGFEVYVLVYDYQLATYVPITNSTSAPQASLDPGDTSALLNAGTFLPPDTGLYAFAYYSYMDNTDADSTNDFTFNLYYISDTMYARDNAALMGGSPDQLIQYNAGVSGSFALAYEAVTDVTITSITTFFLSHTIGDQLSVSIHSMNGGIPDAVLGSSAVFTTTDFDTGGVFMTFELSPPVSMGPGLFAASIDQLTTDPIPYWMNSDISTPGTTFFGTTGAWGLLDTVGTGGGGAAIFPETFLIRPNLDINTGVNAINNVSGVSIFPNPSQGKIYVMNNGSKADMTVNVINNVGQVVYTNKFNQLSTAVIDLVNQPTGVYSVQVKSDSGITTKSIVITNK